MNRLRPPADLAEYLQVTEATLADWRYRGRGPLFMKVGRLVRYRQEDVDDWLASNSSGGDLPGTASRMRRAKGADAGR